LESSDIIINRFFGHGYTAGKGGEGFRSWLRKRHENSSKDNEKKEDGPRREKG